jgi:hypothetical protein
MKHRILRAACLGSSVLLQAGCSIVTPVPLWELAKTTGMVAAAAIPYGASEASNTVYHLHAPFRNVCIEFNPDSAVADVVPALQIELRKHRVESRVYEAGTATDACSVWLRYAASIVWDVPPLSGTYKPYVNSAALTLQATNGSVLSSSQYEIGSVFGMGKWASTQTKLAPVVTALLTGFQN